MTTNRKVNAMFQRLFIAMIKNPAVCFIMMISGIAIGVTMTYIAVANNPRELLSEYHLSLACAGTTTEITPTSSLEEVQAKIQNIAETLAGNGDTDSLAAASILYYTSGSLYMGGGATEDLLTAMSPAAQIQIQVVKNRIARSIH